MDENKWINKMTKKQQEGLFIKFLFEFQDSG